MYTKNHSRRALLISNSSDDKAKDDIKSLPAKRVVYFDALFSSCVDTTEFFSLHMGTTGFVSWLSSVGLHKECVRLMPESMLGEISDWDHLPKVEKGVLPLGKWSVRPEVLSISDHKLFDYLAIYAEERAVGAFSVKELEVLGAVLTRSIEAASGVNKSILTKVDSGNSYEGYVHQGSYGAWIKRGEDFIWSVSESVVVSLLMFGRVSRIEELFNLGILDVEVMCRAMAHSVAARSTGFVHGYEKSVSGVSGEDSVESFFNIARASAVMGFEKPGVMSGVIEVLSAIHEPLPGQLRYSQVLGEGFAEYLKNLGCHKKINEAFKGLENEVYKSTDYGDSLINTPVVSHFFEVCKSCWESQELAHSIQLEGPPSLDSDDNKQVKIAQKEADDSSQKRI